MTAGPFVRGRVIDLRRGRDGKVVSRRRFMRPKSLIQAPTQLTSARRREADVAVVGNFSK